MTSSLAAVRTSYARTCAPSLLAVAMACSPATPAPITSTLAGGTVPAAVMNIGKNFGSSSAPSSAALYPETVAWDERASMDCARLILGTRSRLYAVTPRLARTSTTSGCAAGCKKLTRLTPSGSSSASSTVGGCTRATTCASAMSDAASPTTVAPFSAYDSSLKEAAVPAPAWIDVSTPVADRRVTTSGTVATRLSPGRDSDGTASLTGEYRTTRASSRTTLVLVKPPLQGIEALLIAGRRVIQTLRSLTQGRR